MVTNATSLTGNGVRDWLIQRITAVLLAIYTLFLVSYLMLHTPLSYNDWHALFQNTCMRIATFLVLLSIVYHTWVGMWMIFTDYLKCAYLRLTSQVLTVLGLLSCLAWGVLILIRFN